MAELRITSKTMNKDGMITDLWIDEERFDIHKIVLLLYRGYTFFILVNGEKVFLEKIELEDETEYLKTEKDTKDRKYLDELPDHFY